jgi:hypothetical protein
MLQLWSSDILFSKYNSEKGLFQQGLLPNLINNNNKENLYLHLDGFNPNDLSTIENFILNLNTGHVFWEVRTFLSSRKLKVEFLILVRKFK